VDTISKAWKRKFRRLIETAGGLVYEIAAVSDLEREGNIAVTFGIGVTQDYILGNFQPSLPGLVRLSNPFPGLTSWATPSRPSGTQLGESRSHAGPVVPVVLISSPVQTFSAASVRVGKSSRSMTEPGVHTGSGDKPL
jgi:hypothetical protein